jgi:hypothetical protein
VISDWWKRRDCRREAQHDFNLAESFKLSDFVNRLPSFGHLTRLFSFAKASAGHVYVPPVLLISQSLGHQSPITASPQFPAMTAFPAFRYRLSAIGYQF